MKKLSQRVLEKMHMLEIDQPTLADMCGVDQSQISRLVKGKIKRTPSYIYKLSKALETSTRWLETGVDDVEPARSIKEDNSILPRHIERKTVGMAIDILDNLTENERKRVLEHYNHAPNSTPNNIGDKKRGA